MTDPTHQADAARTRPRDGFGRDFRRFFVRGLSAVLPTLITLWLVTWAWNFLWESMGRYVILAVQKLWVAAGNVDRYSAGFDMRMAWAWPEYGEYPFGTKLIGVLVATVLVYLLGVLIGNFIGRTAYRISEDAVMRLPFIRAIYPAVKQITDFLLVERSNQFTGSRVVAVRPHADGIWSIGLITGAGLRHLSDSAGQEMVTVFVPSSPTAFSGYVLVVPRTNVVDLPLTVEEALRMLVSGGVLTPDATDKIAADKTLLKAGATGAAPPTPDVVAGARGAVKPPTMA